MRYVILVIVLLALGLLVIGAVSVDALDTGIENATVCDWSGGRFLCPENREVVDGKEDMLSDGGDVARDDCDGRYADSIDVAVQDGQTRSFDYQKNGEQWVVTFSCNNGVLTTESDVPKATEVEDEDMVEADDCLVPENVGVFDAAEKWDWNSLEGEVPPTHAAFLEMHDLTQDDVQEYDVPMRGWEPDLEVVELDESLYGEKTVPLHQGYVYTVALCDGSVQTFWGGDPAVEEVTLQWGFSARWVPSYLDLPYRWLDPADMTEFIVRENRFGRYRRSSESGLPGLPYFDRWGPYQTTGGNVIDWDPPSLDAVCPDDYRDGAAMLGGLANPNEWTINKAECSAKWRYSEKEPGSATYCPADMPCWQTTYVPMAADETGGYIELWADGGPKKFYWDDLDELLSGRLNVDEFSYHGFGESATD